MKTLFSLVILMSAFAARAESTSDNGSQFQHQTAAGLFEATPALYYEDTTAKFQSGRKTTVTTLNEKLMGEYGINEMFSAGLALQLVNSKSSYTGGSTTEKGLMDPDFFLNGRAPVGMGSFRFGTHLTLPLDKSTTDSSSDTNAATGGYRLSPFVGYEMKMGQGTFGARLAYDLLVGDQKYKDESSSPTSTGVYKDGNVFDWTFFYESELSSKESLLGVDLHIRNVKKSEIRPDSTGVTTDYGIPLSQIYVDVYGAFEVTPAITILPTLTYTKLTAYSSDINSYDGFAFQIAGRFAF